MTFARPRKLLIHETLDRAKRVGHKWNMDLSFTFPDDIATRLQETDGDFPRRAFEAIVAEEYRLGHLSKPDLRRLLGFKTSIQIDGFLKNHGVMLDYTMEDLERDSETLSRLGL